MNALVLCGGGGKGAVEVGLYRALHELGIAIDLVVGTSIGAVNGALIAARVHPDRLDRLWLEVRRWNVLRPNPEIFWRGLGAASLFSGHRVARYLRGVLPIHSFDELPVRLVVTATDLATGELVALERGDLVEAVRASTAIPGLFPPVHRDGRVLVDGAVRDSIPIEVAARHGASRVFCVLCDCCVDRRAVPRGFARAVEHVLSLWQRRCRKDLREVARRLALDLVLVEPPVQVPLGLLDLRHTRTLLEAGYRESLRQLRSTVVRSRSARGQEASV